MAGPWKASLANARALLDRLNVSDGIPPAVGSSGRIHVAKCTYDFGVDGGTASTFVKGDVIPAGAVVCGGYMHVRTVFTGGATIAVSIEGANDIQTAVADSGAPWSTTGKKAIVPKFNTPESTSITLTAPRRVTFTRTVANITAGKVDVYLFYLKSN